MSGRQVSVYTEHGVLLFHGTIANTEAPWMFWNRVIPDPGPIDLPPAFKIRDRADNKYSVNLESE